MTEIDFTKDFIILCQLYKEKKYSQMVDLMNDLLEHAPDFFDNRSIQRQSLNYFCGYVYYKGHGVTSNFQLAQYFLEKTMVIDNNIRSKSMNILGIIFYYGDKYISKNHSKSKNYFEGMLSIEMQSSLKCSAYYFLGRICNVSKELEKSIDYFQKVIDLSANPKWVKISTQFVQRAKVEMFNDHTHYCNLGKRNRQIHTLTTQLKRIRLDESDGVSSQMERLTINNNKP